MAVGSITRQTISNSPMPSSRAAWIRSSGTVRKNCRIRKMPNADTLKGRMSAAIESSRPA